MKSLLHASLGTVAALLVILGAGAALAQSSTYLSLPENADYSGMTPEGGDVVVPYGLFFGTPPPSLGTQFDITITVSAITSYVPGVTYAWTTTGADPSLGVAGLNYPANLLDTLPASNQTTLPLTVGGVTLDPGLNTRLWMEANFAEGNLEFLGEFTLTISALPSTPGYHAPTQLNIWSESHSLLVDGGVVLAGFWATMGPPLNESDAEGATRLTDFNTSLTYRFTGFSNGASLPITSLTPMWSNSGFVQFDAVPEPSVYMLLGFAGLVGYLVRRRK